MYQSNYREREFYRRNLPHLFPKNGTFFFTFNLYGAIPQSVLKSYREALASTTKMSPTEAYKTHRAWFLRFEKALHHSEGSPHWLKQEPVARLVYDSILFRHGKVYELDCFVLMSNHVHMVFSLNGEHEQGTLKKNTPTGIMHSLKSYTGNQANKILGRSGKFWQVESYDRWVRDPEEWERVVQYVLNNPVKAGLVGHWQEWPWVWLRDGVSGF